MSASGASAPGKMMLSGEYAVLDGAPAIVAAVQKRAIASWSEDLNSALPHPETAKARELAEGELGAVPRGLTLDVTRLRTADNSAKLGVGSSAAGAAAGTAAVFAWHAEEKSDAMEQRMLRIALDAHRVVAPNGSGADVAASVLGGFVHFEKRGDEVFAKRIDRAPPGLTMRVVWTGKEAKTAPMVANVKEFARVSPDDYQACMKLLFAAAERFAAGFAEADATKVVWAAADYSTALRQLGDKADVPIVEETLSEIESIAAKFGGCAKPSGAGGGDVAIVFFAGNTDVNGFDAAIEAGPYRLVDVELGGPGAVAE